MTRDPAEVQAVARLLSEGVVVICVCGRPDTNTSDGRRRHQQLHGHSLSGTETRGARALELANGGDGTGAGGVDDRANAAEATSWANRSVDYPKAPAQAITPVRDTTTRPEPGEG